MKLLDSPPLFSDKVSSADPDYDDAVLEDMLHQAHRAQSYHSLREDLVVILSSSSMSYTLQAKMITYWFFVLRA